jgi:hypothetical protein
MQRQHHPVHVLRELFRIGIGTERSRFDSLANRRGQHVDPIALQRDETIPDQPRPIVELGRGRNENAAAGERLIAFPGDPAIEQRLHAPSAARLVEGGADDGL